MSKISVKLVPFQFRCLYFYLCFGFLHFHFCFGVIVDWLFDFFKDLIVMFGWFSVLIACSIWCPHKSFPSLFFQPIIDMGKFGQLLKFEFINIRIFSGWLTQNLHIALLLVALLWCHWLLLINYSWFFWKYIMFNHVEQLGVVHMINHYFFAVKFVLRMG